MSLHRLNPVGGAFGVAAAVVAADYASKYWARHDLARHGRHLFGPVNFKLRYNTGFSFSLSHQRPLLVGIFTLMALAAATVLAFFAHQGAATWAFGFFVGGGFGNLVDRFASRPHAVTDFVSVGSFPTFNLADAAITGGVLVMIWLALRAKPLVSFR